MKKIKKKSLKPLITNPASVPAKTSSKFEEGKWYTMDEHPNWYVKYLSDDNSRFNTSEYISPDKKLEYGGQFGKIEGEYTFREVTDMTLVRKLLPEDHIDQLVPDIKDLIKEVLG